MTDADQLTSLLRALGERARDEKPDLSPAAPVLGDLGRLIFRGSSAQVQDVQAAVGALRERLEVGEEEARRPTNALVGADSHVFLAGALWAISELMSTRLDDDHVRSEAATVGTRRTQIYRFAQNCLLRGGPVSASQCAASDEGQRLQVRLDELSRAFSDLVRAGHVEIIRPTAGADQRTKYFALTPAGTKEAEAHGAPA